MLRHLDHADKPAIERLMPNPIVVRILLIEWFNLSVESANIRVDRALCLNLPELSTGKWLKFLLGCMMGGDTGGDTPRDSVVQQASASKGNQGRTTLTQSISSSGVNRSRFARLRHPSL